MKALTVWQPWASLLVVGAKRVETRSWATKHLGRIAIHSAARPMPLALRETCVQEPFRSALRLAPFEEDTKNAACVFHFIVGTTELPRGKILGTADLIECVPVEELVGLSEPELSFGDYSAGRYGWVFGSARRLVDPIPYRGHQRLWNLPDDVLDGREWVDQGRAA